MRLQKPRSGKNTRQDLWRFTSYRFADENRLYEAGFLSVKPGTNEACARAGKHFSWEKNFKSIHTSRGPACVEVQNINKKTLELFQAYDWPGNIRELQNVIERAVILCETETFSVDETWLKREEKRAGPAVPFVATIVEREKEIIEAALTACQGRIAGLSGAATKLGIPRQTLESKIVNLGINKNRFKPA